MHRGTQRTDRFYAKMKRAARLALSGAWRNRGGDGDKPPKAYIFAWARIPYAMRNSTSLAERRKSRALRCGSSAWRSHFPKLRGAKTGGRENIDENGDGYGVDRRCRAQCRGERRAGV